MISKIDIDEVGTLIQELVRTPTQNPPGNKKSGAEFIDHKLRQCVSGAYHVPEPCEDRQQAWAHVDEEGDGPTLILKGHIDVIPEGDTSQWDFPPFGE